MKIKKRILSLALFGTMAFGLMPGMTMTASATESEPTTSYTITIPSTLTVANSGWNATDGISATGTLASGKKLTVTASSDDEFALVSGTNKVNYKLAESGDTNTTIDSATEKTAWEFTTLDGTAQGLGIVVEDYSSKPAGTYQDTVTFTAKVAKAYALGGQPINNGTVIKVNFKWRGTNGGDYVQGTYNADSGTFTASKGGSYWGSDDRRAIYKFEKNENLITVGAGLYDYRVEGMQWTFNTETDTYTYTPGDMPRDRPNEFGLISVTLNGTDITSQLTKQ